MVWCASTLWAETGDGYFRDRWLEELRRRGVTPTERSVTRLSSSSSPRGRRSKRSGAGRSPSPGSDTDGLGTDNEFDDEAAQQGRRSPTRNELRLAKEQQERDALAKELDETLMAHQHRAALVRSDKQNACVTRRQTWTERLRQMRATADAQSDAKKAATEHHIQQRERRFLNVMDQCQNDEEVRALQAATFLTLTALQQFPKYMFHFIVAARKIRILKLVFAPMMMVWHHRRRLLAKIYVSRWRGRFSKPSSLALRNALPAIESWGESTVEKLIHGARKGVFSSGQKIVYEGEPGVCGVFVASGRVAIRQRRPNAPDLELGERGAGYVHGEEQLCRPHPLRHYTSLVALDTTYVWMIPRAVFSACAQQEAVAQGQTPNESAGNLQRSTSLLKGGKLMADFQASVRSSKKLNSSHLEEYATAAMSQCRLVFKYWTRDELIQMFASATEVVLPRGEVLFTPQMRAQTCYFVARGTIVQVVQTKRLPQGNEAQQHNNNKAMENGGSGGGGGGAMDNSMNSTSNPNLFSTNAAAAATTTTSSATAVPPQQQQQVDFERYSESFSKTYASAGQLLSYEPLLFGSATRQGYAIAATDATVLEIAHTSWTVPMLSNPHHLCDLKVLLNRKRCSVLIPPNVDDLCGGGNSSNSGGGGGSGGGEGNIHLASTTAMTGGGAAPSHLTLPPASPSAGPLHSASLKLLHRAVATYFVKVMRPVVASRGETLPLRWCALYLQQGAVSYNGMTFKAPIVLFSHEALKVTAKNFEAALANGSIKLQKATAGGGGKGAAAGGNDGAGGAVAAGKAGVGARGGAAGLRAAAAARRAHAAVPSATTAPTPSSSLPSSGAADFANPTMTTANLEASSGGDTLPPPLLGPSDVTSHLGPAPLSPAPEYPHFVTPGGGMTMVVHPPFVKERVPRPTDLYFAATDATAAQSDQLEGNVTTAQQSPQAGGDDDGGDDMMLYAHLSPAQQLDLLAADLLDGLPVVHKCLSRVDAFAVRYVDLLRRFRGQSQLSDYLASSLLVEMLTPPVEDNNNSSSNPTGGVSGA